MSVERPRQKLAWFCSVTLLACLVGAPLARTQSVTPTIQSTIEVLRAHDYPRALETAQALAREHPDDARVWTRAVLNAQLMKFRIVEAEPANSGP
jgi:hypothetical protein